MSPPPAAPFAVEELLAQAGWLRALAQRLAGRKAPRQVGLNENLAREILELHTVGVNGGYTQADVTEFARALTGAQ